MWDNIDRMLSLSLSLSPALSPFLSLFFLSPFLSFSVLLNLSLSLLFVLYLIQSLSIFIPYSSYLHVSSEVIRRFVAFCVFNPLHISITI